jgi:hypothetical protein
MDVETHDNASPFALTYIDVVETHDNASPFAFTVIDDGDA